jgi:hypothetical protein
MKFTPQALAFTLAVLAPEAIWCQPLRTGHDDSPRQQSVMGAERSIDTVSNSFPLCQNANMGSKDVAKVYCETLMNMGCTAGTTNIKKDCRIILSLLQEEGRGTRNLKAGGSKARGNSHQNGACSTLSGQRFALCTHVLAYQIMRVK